MVHWIEGKQMLKHVVSGSAQMYSMAVCVYPANGVEAELMSTKVDNKCCIQV